MKKSTAVVGSVSRRQLFKGATGLTFMLTFGPAIRAVAQEESGVGEKFRSTWVRINTDGIITIYNPVAEMGQGSGSSLPLILAEELDADWQKVRVEHSPINAEIYGFDTRFGKRFMMTVGSQAVEAYFDRLRIAGAQIRLVLLQNAAADLGVPLEELTTEASTVHHSSSGRKLSYGDIAAFAKMPAELPDIELSELKPSGQYRLIGHSHERIDTPQKVDGSAQYAIDVSVPGMQYAMIQRSPVNGASLLEFNADKIESMKDITAVFALDHGVGIVGTNLWSVMKARKELKIQWSKDALAAAFDSDTVFETYAQAASKPQTEPKVIAKSGAIAAATGDVAGAKGTAPKSLSAVYLNDFVYHAQMEPLNAVASVSANKKSVELWIGSQYPDGLKTDIAKLLETDEQAITIHQTYLGGGFGRRFWPDFGLEAVELSSLSGVPVKLIWSREDDLQYGAFRPLSLQRLEAKFNDEGELVSWQHRVVGQNAINDMMIAGSGADIPHYDIAHKQIDQVVVPGGIRCSHWRAVGHGPNKFAIESFIDEICHEQGEDPYEFRRRLMKKSPRALKVLDEVVAMSGYGSDSANGRAMGLAFCEHKDSLSAGVVEISLNEGDGKIRVHRAWIAADAGLIVQPDSVISQLEGAIIQGLSSALQESVSIKAGAVQQSNFQNYHVMTIADVPEINIRIIQSDEKPTGIGELGISFTGPAIANAFAALTGKRLRHMPFSTANVKIVLAGQAHM